MKKNILFCGTPRFAITSLNSIFDHQKLLRYNLVGVITIPDTVSGRGHKKQMSAIKKEAQSKGIKVFEPIDLSNNIFINQIKKLKIDLMVVVAFKKLPKILFEIPTLGTINLHASLLPKYRGAAPINWAIINGEKETGLTTFFINDKIDTGDIILQSKIMIKKDWHADDLHDILMKHSYEIIKDTIQAVLKNQYKRQQQTNNLSQNVQYAPKIHKDDLIVDHTFWKKNSLLEIYNFIRGMSPPGVRTKWNIISKKSDPIEKNIKIIRISQLKQEESNDSNSNNNIEIFIDTSDNTIKIKKLDKSFLVDKIKTENGKELTGQEFINGFLKNKKELKTIEISKDKVY